MYIRDM